MFDTPFFSFYIPSAMNILGIETSCDETSVAVVRDGRDVLFHAVHSQTAVHKPYDGVVPELSARAHLETLNPFLAGAERGSGLALSEMDCFAVTNRPGLVGSLITGVAAAKALSWAFRKPLIGVNHVLAHLYACFLTDPPPVFPFIGLVVSGGHTLLLTVRSWEDVTVEGSTIDDAAGEAFDKVSRILGLGYPGGPAIDRLAETGDPDSIRFPEINMYNKKKDNFDFSYSGLKTAVLFHRKKNPSARIEDVAASFRKAAIMILYKKSLRLSRARGIPRILVAGGVAANALLRRVFSEPCDVRITLPPPNLTGDNAAMVAGLAYHDASAGKFDAGNLNAYARNDLPTLQGARR